MIAAFDQIINVTFYWIPEGKTKPEPVLTISCPDTGYKPEIEFSCQMVPGGATLGATLSIKNLNCTDALIRKWTSFSAEVGYASAPDLTAVFYVPIFNCYPQSGPPNRVTVFKGIAGGTGGSLESGVPLHMKIYYDDGVLLSVFLRELCSKLEIGYAAGNDAVLADYDKAISIPMHDFVASNKYAVIQWICLNLPKWTASESADGIPVETLSCTYWNNEIKVSKKQEGDSVAGDEQVVPILSTTNAQFDGSILTLTAPFDGRVMPNSLIYVPFEYMTNNMANVVTLSQLKGQGKTADLYRVILMDMKFSTTGSMGTMTLKAVGYQYVAETLIKGEDDIKGSREYLDMMAQQEASLKVKPLELVVGKRKVDASVWGSNTVQSQDAQQVPLSGLMQTYGPLVASAWGGIEVPPVTEEQAKQIAEGLADANYTVVSSSAIEGITFDPKDLWPVIPIATLASAGVDVSDAFNLDAAVGSIEDGANSGLNMMVPNWKSLSDIKADKNLVAAAADWFGDRLAAEMEKPADERLNDFGAIQYRNILYWRIYLDKC